MGRTGYSESTGIRSSTESNRLHLLLGFTGKTVQYWHDV